MRRKNSTSPKQPIKFVVPSLDSNLVRKYINDVYLEYSIPDPLDDVGYAGEESTRRYSLSTTPLNSTNRKAIALKDKFLTELVKEESFLLIIS